MTKTTIHVQVQQLEIYSIFLSDSIITIIVQLRQLTNTIASVHNYAITYRLAKVSIAETLILVNETSTNHEANNTRTTDIPLQPKTIPIMRSITIKKFVTTTHSTTAYKSVHL